MANVKPRKGGPYSLYCYDCGEWVPNTANAEMAKEGCYAHSHWCKKPDPRAASEITWHVAEEIAEARAEGAQAERERIRTAVEAELEFATGEYDRMRLSSSVTYWSGACHALRSVLRTLDPEEGE